MLGFTSLAETLRTAYEGAAPRPPGEQWLAVCQAHRAWADGDLFFDIEGARYYSEDRREFGLQYLLGVVDTAEADEAGLPRYTQIWAFDRAGEKRAFEELIDFITERRTRHPRT